MRDTGYAIRVPTGGNAVMTIPNPWGDPHIEWSLRYSRDLNDSSGRHGGAGRFTAAEILASFDYLVSDAITMKEATRRLRVLRHARDAALKAGDAETENFNKTSQINDLRIERHDAESPSAHVSGVAVTPPTEQKGGA